MFICLYISCIFNFHERLRFRFLSFSRPFHCLLDNIFSCLKENPFKFSRSRLILVICIVAIGQKKWECKMVEGRSHLIIFSSPLQVIKNKCFYRTNSLHRIFRDIFSSLSVPIFIIFLSYPFGFYKFSQFACSFGIAKENKLKWHKQQIS